MTNDFRERIRNYQNSGDRLVIDEILYGTTFDFMNDPTRQHQIEGNALKVRIDLPRHEYYISYRIRVLRDFALQEYIGVPRGAEYEDFCYYITALKYEYGIDFGAAVLKHNEELEYYRLTVALFEKIDARRDEILENVYDHHFQGFYRGYHNFRDKIISQESAAVVATEQVDKNIVQALERALGYVDTAKSEREIVRYVNSAFSTKFGELELERKGMKRIYRVNGQDKTVKLFVKKHFPANLYGAILPGIKERHLEELSKQQVEFIQQAHDIVLADRTVQDLTNYSCRANGAALIKRDYLAEKLEKSPESVRKMLSRIKKRVTN